MTVPREDSSESSATVVAPPAALAAEEVASEPPDPLLGRNIGRKFVLEKLLGAGAMGAVYRARQTALEKVVAIKVMHGELARDPMFAGRFHREAKAASRLDHPNSIRILDYGQDDDGLLYIAMEYLDGRDLGRLLNEEWPLTPSRIVDLLAQALGAIAVAHDLGITHRDLKPENIMVLRRTTDEGVEIDVVKVCDFGIAKLVEQVDEGGDAGSGRASRGKLTTAGLVIGTPAYMSPEQGRGDAIDARSDLYSVGVILYQILTGQLPFDAPSAIGIVIKHQSEEPKPPRAHNPSIDPRLETVCLRAMQKLPANRYQTARELRAALREATDSSFEPQTGPYSHPARSSSALAGSSPLPGGLPPTTQPALAAAESPGIATARTELQLAAAPTGSVSTLAAREPEAPGKKRWGIIAGAGAALAIGFVAWQSQHTKPVALSAAERAAPSAVASGEPRPSASPPARAEGVPAPVAPSLLASVPASNPSTVKASPALTVPRQAATPLTAPRQAAAAPAAPEPEVPAITVATAAPVVFVAPPASVTAAPPPPSFDSATATVVARSATGVQGTRTMSVNNAVGRVNGALTACYRRELSNIGSPLAGVDNLHIETDETGIVLVAKLGGPVGGALTTCIEAAVKGMRVEGVDTGSASAEIPLVFKPQ